VSYNGKCVVVPIVDMCPGCSEGLDISLPAMGELVGGTDNAVEVGVINTDYEIVQCPRNRAARQSPPEAITDTDPCSGEEVTPPEAPQARLAPSSTEEPTTEPSPSSEPSGTQDPPVGAAGAESPTPSPRPPRRCRPRQRNSSTNSGSSTTPSTCTLFGHPCCQHPEDVPSSSVDANGWLWGFENGQSCVVAK
jgi:Cellulose or protein binding domain